jgi:hypothetical protein
MQLKLQNRITTRIIKDKILVFSFHHSLSSMNGIAYTIRWLPTFYALNNS